MGIQDRDYYRDGSNRFFDAWGRQGAVVWIIIVTSVVFLGQSLSGSPGPGSSELVRWGCYSPGLVMEGEVWRLVTPMFLHANLFHIFFNMMVLYWAGSRLEELYGSREFFIFYLAAGTLAQVLFLFATLMGAAPPAASIGASGAVTAVLVVYAFHFPYQQVLLFFIIPMPVWLLVCVCIGLDVLGVFGGRDGPVAYWVHLGGALFGFLYYQSGFRFANLYSFVPRLARHSQTRPPLRVVSAEPEGVEPVAAVAESRPKSRGDEHLEARVDQVLEKVSRFGQESLTAEEREILFKASEIYKKKRQ